MSDNIQAMRCVVCHLAYFGTYREVYGRDSGARLCKVCGGDLEYVSLPFVPEYDRDSE